MNTYEGNLQHSLENILYMDRSRISLKSTDFDVLALLSGDEEAIIHGLKQFHLNHEDKTVLIHNGGSLEVKVFGLFPDPDQESQKVQWKKNHRFKDGKFPQGRPYRRGNTWKK